MSPRETFRIRSPEDLLAVVPVVLGFHPDQSLVMLTFPTRGPAFHARLDLPTEEAGLEEAVADLLAAARRNAVDRVCFVAYAEDAGPARTALLAAHDAFDGADLDVVDLLWAHGDRWESLREGVPGPRSSGRFDAGAHPFAVRAVVAGRVTHGSRADLAATLAPVPEEVQACRDAVAQGAVPSAGRAPADGGAPSELWWAAETVLSCVAEGRRLESDEVARLVVAAADDETMAALCLLASRIDAVAHTDLWADVVRRCPEEWLPGPAALLAHSAWLGGDGALAWCALDRCHAVEPGHPLGGLVADLLVHAVPPGEGERGLPDSA